MYLRVVAGLVRHQVVITTMREDVTAMTDEEPARALLHASETLALAAARARLFGGRDAYGLTYIYAFRQASGSPLIALHRCGRGSQGDAQHGLPRREAADRWARHDRAVVRTHVGVGRLVCRASCVASITCK